jgi:sRNA-binding protein
MRRIVLVLVLVVVLAIAGYMLLRPKGTKARPKSKTALTDTSDYGGSQSSGAVRPAGARRTSGKVAGKLKASTAAERRAQAKQIKAAERARKRELKRAEREKKRMLKRSARARRGRSGRKGEGMYVLKAVVATGGDNYALVDGRKVQVGDFVLGRKIVEISPDRIEIEAFGKRSTVRVGESLMPSSYAPTTGRKR